ncbi:hypothetical protein [Sunxiuqinia indica]|uniref:hypothetical protein n=1 Tax=Sunxiuqinia indica TaxID=2692584 RepID=UPI0013595083|nr:hypothetical protein [Sunxiuqinia indica]
MKNAKPPKVAPALFESTGRKTSKPNQPVASFIQEASNLYVWCLDDLLKLNSVGISTELINELPLRIETCKNAQSYWNKQLNTTEESQIQWRKAAPQAIQLRKELLTAMRYAFQNKPASLALLSGISKRHGYTDLIQDLNNIASLGRSNAALLTNISFDLSLLDEAANTSKMLAELWATAKAERNSNAGLKRNRNKAYWHLHQLVSEIREAGKYVFRNDKSRYIGYTSPFWRNKYQKRSRQNPAS